MGNKLGNGSLRVVTGVLTGVVLILAGGLGTTFISSFAKAADTVSRPEVQTMIDKDVGVMDDKYDLVREDLKRIESKLDRFLDMQGGG